MKEERKRLVAKIAYLYFVEGKSQAKISEDLGIHRTSVSRMLTKAKEEGIVKIKIDYYSSELLSLEELARKKFQIKRVELVESSAVKQEIIMDNVTTRAAELVKNLIKSSDNIGISWGYTLSKMVDKMEPKKIENITFCPLAGGPSHINIKYHVNTLVYELSHAYRAESIFINSSVLKENKLLAQKTLNSNGFEELTKLWNNLDLAIVGVGGGLDKNDSQWRDLLTETDYKILKNNGAIGECCCRFFDEKGSIVYPQLQERIIAITFEQLSNIPEVIAVAQGKEKASAIKALLNKRLITHLITDKDTILEVLKLDSK